MRAILERQASGESLRKVAERAKVSHHAVAKFVKGGGLTLRVAGRLCDELGLSLQRDEEVRLIGAEGMPSQEGATGSEEMGMNTLQPTVGLGAEDVRGREGADDPSERGREVGASERTGHFRAEAKSEDEDEDFETGDQDGDTEAYEHDDDNGAYEDNEDIEAGDPVDEPDPEVLRLLNERHEARWLHDWAGWRGGEYYFHHVWMLVDRYNRPLYRLSHDLQGRQKEKLDYFVAGVVEFNPKLEAVLSHEGLVEAFRRMVASIPLKIIFIPLGARIEPRHIDRVLTEDALFFPDLLLGLEFPRAGEELPMGRSGSPAAGPLPDKEPGMAPVAGHVPARETAGLPEQAEGGREIPSTEPVKGPCEPPRDASVHDLLFASQQARAERERLSRRQPPKPPPAPWPSDDEWEEAELKHRSKGPRIADAQARKFGVSSRGLSREIAGLGEQIDGWVPKPHPGFRVLVERYGAGKGSSADRKKFFCFLEAVARRNPEGAEVLAHPLIGDVYKDVASHIDHLIDMRYLGQGIGAGDIDYRDTQEMKADLRGLLARLHGRIRQYTTLGGIRGLGDE